MSTEETDRAVRLDHRDLNRDLRVFATDPLAGAGLPLWLPDGAVGSGRPPRPLCGTPPTPPASPRADLPWSTRRVRPHSTDPNLTCRSVCAVHSGNVPGSAGGARRTRSSRSPVRTAPGAADPVPPGPAPAAVTSRPAGRYCRLPGPALATIAANGGITSATADIATAAVTENRQIKVHASTISSRHTPIMMK
jgi:hypothetical protein